MENYQPHLDKTVSYYDLLLKRYARRLIQDEEQAAKIVQDVLESQYDLNALVPSEHLRQVLKTDVLNHCYYFIQSKIFDRPLIKVPYHFHPKRTNDLNEDLNPLVK